MNHTVYNPYPRADNSSMPNLALQTHGRSNANNSPDLVSRRNLQHSVDDLTEIVRSDDRFFCKMKHITFDFFLQLKFKHFVIHVYLYCITHCLCVVVYVYIYICVCVCNVCLCHNCLTSGGENTHIL